MNTANPGAQGSANSKTPAFSITPHFDGKLRLEVDGKAVAVFHEYIVESAADSIADRLNLFAQLERQLAQSEERVAALEEQLRLANIDAASESVEANEWREWVAKIKELQPAIESLTTDCEERYPLSSVSTKHLSALLALLSSSKTN